MSVETIETPRLGLKLLQHTALEAMAAEDRGALEILLDCKIPPEFLEEAWLAKWRLEQLAEDPAYLPWSIRAVILNEEKLAVGSMNCHAAPQPLDVNGIQLQTIEMGYTIFSEWRQRGIAFEMVQGFCKFGQARGAEALRLAIAPGNQASRRLAEKLGAYKIGVQIDEIDGLEEVWISRLPLRGML